MADGAPGRPVLLDHAVLTWHYLRMSADMQARTTPDPDVHDHVVTLDEEGAVAAAAVFRLLADPTRLSLLWHLRERERSVNELAQLVDRPPPAVSQHLAKLRLSRLVSTRRTGTTVHYSLVSSHVGRLVVDALSHAQHAEDPA